MTLWFETKKGPHCHLFLARQQNHPPCTTNTAESSANLWQHSDTMLLLLLSLSSSGFHYTIYIWCQTINRWMVHILYIKKQKQIMDQSMISSTLWWVDINTTNNNLMSSQLSSGSVVEILSHLFLPRPKIPRLVDCSVFDVFFQLCKDAILHNPILPNT